MYRLFFLSLAVLTAGFSHELGKENFVETENNGESSTSLVEPPIYGLYTNSRVSLKDQELVLNAFLVTDSSITTAEGKRFFTPAADGLIVNVPGLYRISFFQMVYTLNSESHLILNLDRISSTAYSRLHTQELNLGIRDGAGLQFTLIARMDAGEKFKLTAVSYKGEATLLNGANISGFTVEAIGK